MESIRIEILNSKAMEMINEMVGLKLIKVSEEPTSKIKSYLNKMRRKAASAPSLEEITEIVEEVRAKRYAKK